MVNSSGSGGAANEPPAVVRELTCTATVCDPVRACLHLDPVSGAVISGPPLVTTRLVNGRPTTSQPWCPTGSTPNRVAVEVAIRQQALRLLPRVTIGSAWRSRALVNAEAVLWAATGRVRELPQVTVVGRRVRVRVAFDHASWTFGDGTSDTTSTPGKPYDPAGTPCGTAQCPDYYGHTYTEPGHRTITLQVTWRAQFSLDGATWRDIPQPVTGPVDRRDLEVVEARGVLVPD